MTKPVFGRRYLALWLPFLASDRLSIARGSGATLPDAPTVFIEKQRGAMRIAAVSPAAHALGIGAGMTLADAQAQLPELMTAFHDPEADACLLERIADACDRYSPSVAVDPPDALVIDITGCVHLFGDEAALVADIRRRFTVLHLRIACADGPEPALALARYGGEEPGNGVRALAALPVAALRLEESVETGLKRAGLFTIGDLADRPAAPLAARFGAHAVAALERLTGRADSRIIPRRAPPDLIVERRFAEPLTQTEAALSILEAMIADAAADMEQRGQGGRRFAARFYRSDGAVADLSAETSRPVRDTGIVMRLFRERIATLSDPIDPGFGFDMIRLSVPVLERLAPRQMALEGGLPQDEALTASIDRLSTRLGRDRVRRFVPAESHIPECAFRMVPAAEPPSHTVWQAPRTGEPPLRPIQIFDPPQRITVIAEVPDGPPRRFQWRRTAHEVTRHEGPERIASEWWHDGNPGLTRDYYRVEDANGRRFWLFRHGLYGQERRDPAWYIHGLFA